MCLENLLARTEASQTRLNHRFTKFAHTFSNLAIKDLQLANVKRRLDQDLKLEGLCTKQVVKMEPSLTVFFEESSFLHRSSPLRRLYSGA